MKSIMFLTTIFSFAIFLHSCQGQDLDKAFRHLLQSELSSMENWLTENMTHLIGDLRTAIDQDKSSRLDYLEGKVAALMDYIRKVQNGWGAPDEKGWYLAFRGTAGVGKSIYDAYTGVAPKVNIEPCCKQINGSVPCSGHYRNDVILDNWQNIKEVAVRLYNKGTLKQELRFNAINTNYLSWFGREKLISAGNWLDLQSQKNINYFSIVGDFRSNLERRFLINRNYGGCPKDVGWFMAIDTDKKPCNWESRHSRSSFPVFLYTTEKNASNYNTYSKFSTADVMAIFVKPFDEEKCSSN